MKFVDRKEETAILTRAFAREEPSLYVIYGRRRLGKSTLINRLMREDDIYFMADRADQTQQRALLADTIAIHYPGFNNVVYPSWESLFLQLSMVASRCFVLCLDEFPNMVRSCRATFCVTTSDRHQKVKIPCSHLRIIPTHDARHRPKLFRTSIRPCETDIKVPAHQHQLYV